tara:strand:+ start:3096 stop:4340 length:1245 start_codon:yes stop_codon:yes gene_type:complete
MTTSNNELNLNHYTNNMVISFVVVMISVFGTWGLLIVDIIDSKFAAIWILSNVAGFILQRSRFCFASGFRDMFLFGSGSGLKAIIVGLSISTIGFAAIMFWLTPNPTLGMNPPEAHIFPVGISTVVGGLLFGFGMVVAGGCVSGNLYRLGEGYITSIGALLGVMIGMGLLILSWNWWYETSISLEPVIWLPSLLNLGYFGSILLTLVMFILVFFGINWWESRNGIPTISNSGNPVMALTFRDKLSHYYRVVFIEGWTSIVGGALLGGLAIIMFTVKKPFGVTGGIFDTVNGAISNLGFGPETLNGLDQLGGCIGGTHDTIFTTALAMTIGTVTGSLIAAVASGEFKLRFPPTPVRYIQGFFGGIFMGYGAGLAIGCTIGALFSAIPSLSLSGWVFAIALSLGAFTGTKVVEKLI